MQEHWFCPITSNFRQQLLLSRRFPVKKDQFPGIQSKFSNKDVVAYLVFLRTKDSLHFHKAPANFLFKWFLGRDHNALPGDLLAFCKQSYNQQSRRTCVKIDSARQLQLQAAWEAESWEKLNERNAWHMRITWSATSAFKISQESPSQTLISEAMTRLQKLSRSDHFQLLMHTLAADRNCSIPTCALKCNSDRWSLLCALY